MASQAPRARKSRASGSVASCSPPAIRIPRSLAKPRKRPSGVGVEGLFVERLLKPEQAGPFDLPQHGASHHRGQPRVTIDQKGNVRPDRIAHGGDAGDTLGQTCPGAGFGGPRPVEPVEWCDLDGAIAILRHDLPRPLREALRRPVGNAAVDVGVDGNRSAARGRRAGLRGARPRGAPVRRGKPVRSPVSLSSGPAKRAPCAARKRPHPDRRRAVRPGEYGRGRSRPARLPPRRTGWPRPSRKVPRRRRPRR